MHRLLILGLAFLISTTIVRAEPVVPIENSSLEPLEEETEGFINNFVEGLHSVENAKTSVAIYFHTGDGDGLNLLRKFKLFLARSFYADKALLQKWQNIKKNPGLFYTYTIISKDEEKKNVDRFEHDYINIHVYFQQNTFNLSAKYHDGSPLAIQLQGPVCNEGSSETKKLCLFKSLADAIYQALVTIEGKEKYKTIDQTEHMPQINPVLLPEKKRFISPQSSQYGFIVGLDSGFMHGRSCYKGNCSLDSISGSNTSPTTTPLILGFYYSPFESVLSNGKGALRPSIEIKSTLPTVWGTSIGDIKFYFNQIVSARLEYCPGKSPLCISGSLGVGYSLSKPLNYVDIDLRAGDRDRNINHAGIASFDFGFSVRPTANIDVLFSSGVFYRLSPDRNTSGDAFSNTINQSSAFGYKIITAEVRFHSRSNR